MVVVGALLTAVRKLAVVGVLAAIPARAARVLMLLARLLAALDQVVAVVAEAWRFPARLLLVVVAALVCMDKALMAQAEQREEALPALEAAAVGPMEDLLVAQEW
jgi:hypothetical protein